MNKRNLSNFYKAVLTVIGVVCIGWALFYLPKPAYSSGYLFLLAFAVLISPHLSLILPRSKFSVSFSDALIFIAFLVYGGEAAIIAASLEMLANCYFIKRKGNMVFGRYMILTNTFIASISTAITYFVWLQVANLADIQIVSPDTRQLIASLGILALTHFVVSTFLGAVFQILKENTLNLWETWKKDYFLSSMTQIVGAGLAGLIYKLINYGDVFTAGIALIAIGIIYLNYRQSIGEINDAVGNFEKAERDKSEVERVRRREAENHSAQLTVSLEKEERANDALRKSEKDFQHAALHDSLTGLANRKQLGDILRSLIEEYKQDPSANFQVLFLDIRRFKDINDSLGHSIGDKVLVIAAKRFVRMLSPADTVARIGGDEFAIVLRDLATVGKAQKVARRIYQSITQPFSLSGNKISIDVNIGVAPCDVEYETPEDILRDADIAMHYAKEKNDGLAVFTKELRSRFLERVRYEMDLRHAIDRGELSMHYQPIVSLIEGRLIGFEALLRWHHSEFGMIPPNKFIPIAEQSGLIQPITVWILRETTRQLAAWQRISSEYENLMVSVNISGKHLSNDDLIEDVETALEQSKLSPDTLKLEITESSAMENAEHTINMLHKLKQVGVRLSIDDFGTGYSSLSYLHRLPFDTLKIDRSFVSRVGENGENSEILQTIISLAKNLKMRVIAEGIETHVQLAVLQNLGCDYGQGYLLAKPKSRDETEKLLYKRPNLLPFGSGLGFESPEAAHVEENLPVF
ncbi:MAG: bifunctional diguanylate cyclase/phosphodiesterase [Saprospiraceae bacterium]|nr:bifunctional diguanylate cyclase/phosphodiesterase [Pyrinomonadaceae bacterium]